MRCFLWLPVLASCHAFLFPLHKNVHVFRWGNDTKSAGIGHYHMLDHTLHWKGNTFAAPPGVIVDVEVKEDGSQLLVAHSQPDGFRVSRTKEGMHHWWTLSAVFHFPIVKSFFYGEDEIISLSSDGRLGRTRIESGETFYSELEGPVERAVHVNHELFVLHSRGIDVYDLEKEENTMSISSVWNCMVSCFCVSCEGDDIIHIALCGMEGSIHRLWVVRGHPEMEVWTTEASRCSSGYVKHGWVKGREFILFCSNGHLYRQETDLKK